MPGPRGLSGRLDATFTSRADGSVQVHATTRPPLELRGPFAGRALPTYFLRNVTAGTLDGDDYEVNVRVESGADVRVEPTSATKAYSALRRGVRSRVHLEACPGATLQYSAGVTILHTDACLEQTTDIVVHPGAAVAYLEVLALGRLARGERLAFRRYSSSLRVRRPDATPMFEERLVLDPPAQRAAIDAALDGAGVLGTLLLLGGDASEAPRLEDSATIYAGASLLPNGAGVIVRALGNRAEDIARYLEAVVAGQ